MAKLDRQDHSWGLVVVKLNKSIGEFFVTSKGLRQGDPLSPLLFLLPIDPLQRILDKATEEHILSPINHHSASVRVSLYADDAAL